MARYKGFQGDVQIGGASVGERISFDITLGTVTAETNTMGNDWTSTDTLQKSFEGELKVFWDPADPAQLGMVQGAVISAVFYPGGNTTGLSSISGDFVIISKGLVTDVNDMVKTTYSIRNQGNITEAIIV